MISEYNPVHIVTLCKYLLEYDTEKSKITEFNELMKFCKWERKDFISKKTKIEEEEVYKILKFIESKKGFKVIPKNNGLPIFYVDRGICQSLIEEYDKMHIM